MFTPLGEAKTAAAKKTRTAAAALSRDFIGAFAVKFSEFLPEHQIYLAGGAVPVLCDYELGNIAFIACGIVIIVPVYEKNHVGGLLDLSGFPEIGKPRYPVLALFYSP